MPQAEQTDLDARMQHALDALAAGRQDEAAATCQEILARQPNHPDALYVVGVCRFNVNDFETAVDFLARAVNLQPRRAPFRVAQGSALFFLGRFDQAADAFRQALSLDPADAQAHFHMGALAHVRGNTAQAAVCYQRALGCAPNLQLAQDCLEAVRAGLFLGTGSGWQGSHEPARQVFMSAAVSLLRHARHPVRILEVGSYMGASALSWAKALDVFVGGGTLTCTDTWRIDATASLAVGEMDLFLRRTEIAYEAFLRNIQTAPRTVTVDHKRGASGDILPALPADSYNLIYIDASHFAEDVATDIRNADRLLRDGGIMCGDDLELQAHECDIDYARAHPRVDLLTDPRTNRGFHPGVTIAVGDRFGPVSAYRGFWIVRKVGRHYQAVDLHDAEGLIPGHWPKRICDALQAEFAVSGELKAVRPSVS